MNILVTGGAGFIGANFLNLLVPRHPEHVFINLDKLTYAGNLASLRAIASAPNYRFVRCDLADWPAVRAAVADAAPDRIVHFAAESHVDRSILGPREFIQTNIVGTFNLLEACRERWGRDASGRRFHHVSTDEVFGSLGPTGFFTETSAYDPSSPYSASKAASDHLVRAHHRTYGVPVTITNCSNNYGPHHFPEKLVPLMILNALAGKPLPIYGRGDNVRDWLYVEDHCEAIWAVLERGRDGETYAVGGGSERTNRQVVAEICRILAEETGTPVGDYQGLVTHVADRPGHDQRYAIDAGKIRAELGWTPRYSFAEGLRRTVRWYLDNREWVAGVTSGEYRRWMEANYGRRAEDA
jgi:dTDP-glucose 4,6-dehydratase